VAGGGGGGTPGQPEGAVVVGVVLLTLGAQAGGGVLRCHGDHVVAVVPGVLTLLCAEVRDVLGRAAVQGVRRGRGLGGQAALLLVVHEGLLVGPGHGADHLLLAAVRGGGRGRAGVHGHGGVGVRAGVRLAGAWRGGGWSRGGGEGGGGADGLRGRFCGRGQQRFADGERLAAEQLAVQLAVVHHVVHGALHLQQHALLLTLRDPAEAHSWTGRRGSFQDGSPGLCTRLQFSQKVMSRVRFVVLHKRPPPTTDSPPAPFALSRVTSLEVTHI